MIWIAVQSPIWRQLPWTRRYEQARSSWVIAFSCRWQIFLADVVSFIDVAPFLLIHNIIKAVNNVNYNGLSVDFG